MNLPSATGSQQLNIGNLIYGTGIYGGASASSTPVTGGYVGIGVTSPTAVLHLKAGTATASTAPLKFTSGTNLTTPEAGAVEYDGTNLYYTDSTPTRQTLATTTGMSGTYLPLAGATYSTTSGNGLALTSSTLTTGNLVNLASTGTAAGSNTQTVLNIATSGANGTTTQTTYGGQFSNTHTGTSSTNVGLYATASGGTNNYAAIFGAGNVGIGTTSPGVRLETHETALLENMTLGTAGGGFALKAPVANGEFGLFAGVGSSGNAWLQVGRSDGNAITYNLILQSQGGNVGIGTTGPTANLEVVDTDNDGYALRLHRAVNTVGNGVGQVYSLLNSSNAKKDYAGVFGGITTNTAGAEDGVMDFNNEGGNINESDENYKSRQCRHRDHESGGKIRYFSNNYCHH